MNMEPNEYKQARCPHGWVADCQLCAAAVERERCLALRDPLRDWLGDPDEAIRACISEIDRLVLENEALKKDAERYRQSSRQIPDDVLKALAEIETCVESENDCDDPGRVMCHSCEAEVFMRWRHGLRLDTPEDIQHSAACPAIWARAVLKLDRSEADADAKIDAAIRACMSEQGGAS